MNSVKDVWCYTLPKLIESQHRAIEVAAEICETAVDATSADLAEMIRKLKYAINVEDDPKEPSPGFDRMDPDTWLWCKNQALEYQNDAFELAARICDIEQFAHPFELAEMIRSLQKRNRLI
jgi:predicted transcriptional regulator